MPTTFLGRTLRAALPILILASLAPASPRADEPPLARVDPLDRVQLHANANRALPYLPLAQADAEPGAARLVMAPVRTIELDGDPLANVYANLRPLDVDGDGRFEFLHYNGFNFAQVWTADGERLWRVRNAKGRVHDPKAGTYRDTVAVLDGDGDGKQDFVHCWNRGDKRSLVLRRGLDGAPIRSLLLDGWISQECQIAAFRMADTGETQILVAHNITGPNRAACPRNFVGYWTRTIAFDTRLRRLWSRDTCDAGHYAWPLDEDQDGKAEAVFVGKYLLRANGSLRCQLADWPSDDHVDALSIADLDPARPGLEAVAVGRTGVAAYETAGCTLLWRVPTSVIRNPQHVAIAQLDPVTPTPEIVVDERGSVARPKTFILDGQGRIVASTGNVMPVQNADLDGALGVDELVGDFGRVIDGKGNIRLDRSWYWNLKGSKVVETAAGYYPASYDRWQAFPLVFDHDGDGMDELVTWGQSLIVVGKAVLPPAPPPTLKIRRATYGASARCDAKPAVAALCDGKSSCWAYAWNALCGNPDFGAAKTLAVEYACGSQVRIATTPQNTRLTMSCPMPPIAP